MKLTKHGVATFYKNHEVERRWYSSKEAAENSLKRKSNDVFRKYIGTKVIEMYCNACNKDLEPGDTYIKRDEETRYCEKCYEENTVTYYTVGGEPVGDGDDIEAFDTWDQE